MSQVFDAYARYYDLLYRDKDYAGESVYVATLIREQAPQAKRILELGCGTGAHAEHLARMGYIVHGVDMSEAMLARAEARKANLPPDVAGRLSFCLGDVRTVRMSETYDAVVSLFHVMSYQTTYTDLEAAFETAWVHLQPGGLFLFDFWYGPGVLTQKPEVRVKRLEDEEIKVTRIAEPVLYANENLVQVNYTVFIEVKASKTLEQVIETHMMRYLFLSELLRFADTEVWINSKSFGWMNLQELNLNDWAGLFSVTKK